MTLRFQFEKKTPSGHHHEGVRPRRSGGTRLEGILGIALPAILAIVGVVLLKFWLDPVHDIELQARVPGMEGPGLYGDPPLSAGEMPPVVAGDPVHSDGQPSSLMNEWPCFRGSNRDNILRDSVPLARNWSSEGPNPVPKKLWTIEVGPGHAGPAVSGGCVYLLDYDTQAEADTMRCLSLDDGREIWRCGYPIAIPENHGMSRTVSTVVDQKYVVSFGPKCHVACFDAKTGKNLWLIDLVRDYGATVPGWYAGQCPLVDDGRVILAPSGDTLMMAVDCTSGELLWKSPKVRNWEMTHVSILPMEFAGRRMYVYCGTKGVAGIAADDGSLLWETDAWVGRMATCPTPVDVGEGRIFFCSGYQAGSLMLQLKKQDDAIGIERLFRLRPKQFGSEQHTPVFYEGHLYGVRTKPGGEQLVCLDLNGNERWNSGREKFGRGPYLIADGLILLLDDDSTLTLVEATPNAYRPIAQHQVFKNGDDAWAPMALVGGRLILRDKTRLTCLDLAER